MHLPQQAGARTDGTHYRELARPLFARRCYGSEQHNETGCQRKAEQELNRADDLVEHALHLRDGRAHIDVGDVRVTAHQCVVETLGRRRPESGEVGRWHIGQRRHGVHHEEVGVQRAPVDLAQRGDACIAKDAADIEAQVVAELQAERPGQTFFHADLALGIGRPLARCDGVVRGRFGAVAEVEFTIHQALGAVVGIVVGRDRLVVDRDQSPANHRVPVELADAGIAQRFLERIALLGHDVDDEAIGRIGRRRLAPARHEVGAQQHQQYQGKQADRQRTDLYHRIHGARRNLPRCQHQPARCSRLVDAAPQDLDRKPAQCREQRDRRSKTADCDKPQLDVAAGREQQRSEAQHTDCEHRNRRRLEPADIAPDHAQRRHLRKLQHRWKPESKKQRQAHAEAESDRPQRRRRQRRINKTREQCDEDVVHAKADRHAEPTCHQTDDQELE